jgi:defect-in-organelle-trafficking protein DotB
VVLYGETRDAETIKNMTIQAETGVAVYATVHTNSVAETLPRMVREFAHAERHGMQSTLVAAMRGIVHQRLLKDVDGGRVAIREFLGFDEQIRELLLQVPPERLIKTLKTLVKQHGQPLIDDIGAKYRDGRIDQSTYKQMTAIYQQEDKANA